MKMDDSTNEGLDKSVTRYEIVVRGELSEQFAPGLEGTDLKVKDGQTTLLAGEVLDQVQLHGLLNCLSDFGLKLLSFKAISERQGG